MTLLTYAILALGLTGWVTGCGLMQAPTHKPGSVDSRGCDESVHGELSPQWRQRAVKAGPLSLLGSVRSVEEDDGERGEPIGRLVVVKVLAVLEPGADVLVSSSAGGAPVRALLYTRLERITPTPSPADSQVRLIACQDRATQFNGAFVVRAHDRLMLTVMDKNQQWKVQVAFD